MFSKCLTIRYPCVCNNTDYFPGGFLITKLSKLALCISGDALLLGRSLSAGASKNISGRPNCDVGSSSCCLENGRKIGILEFHCNSSTAFTSTTHKRSFSPLNPIYKQSWRKCSYQYRTNIAL